MAKIGLLAAPVTPFKGNDLALDEEAFAALAGNLLKSDSVDGIVPNAHAAEGATLNNEERRKCISIINQVNTKKKKVVPCVVAESLTEAIKQAQDAKELGCDALMVCPPPIYAWTPDDAPEFSIEFHKQIAKEVDIPLVLFVYPEGNPYYYSPATIKRILSEVPNFIAVKLTYKNAVSYQNAYKAIKAVNPEISVMPTSPAMAYPLSCMNAVDGMLAGGANFVADELKQIMELCEKGEFFAARKIHERVLPLAAALLAKPYVFLHSRYKYVAYLTGAIPNPAVRSPQLDITKADQQHLREVAAGAGLKIVR